MKLASLIAKRFKTSMRKEYSQAKKIIDEFKKGIPKTTVDTILKRSKPIADRM